MSYTIADEIFIKTCKKILQEGVLSTTRACWKNLDGTTTPAQTKHVFGVINRYDLSPGSQFPIITLRKINWKLAMDEILWIWQKNSNNVHDLHSHIWDAWADKRGSIGKSYGYQLGKKYKYSINGKITTMNQVEKMFYDLNHDKNSRRIMVSMWNVKDLKNMNLEPCAYSMTFNVTGSKLNAILNQRSSDTLTAGNWNVVQYAILLMMIAHEVGLVPGELVHVIADCHIYDRHIPIVEEMIEKYDADLKYAKEKGVSLVDKDILKIGKDAYFRNTDFYFITTDDFVINGYNPKEFHHKIPVAI